MRWAVVVSVAVFVIVLVLLQPGLQTGNFESVWASLAPNLLAEVIGLAAALVVAEVWIRAYRRSRGIETIAPFVIKSMSDTLALDYDVIEKTGYTPNEFKAIHKEYLEGQMNPIHLSTGFKDRVDAACKSLDMADVDVAVDACKSTEDFVAKYAGVLEPKHLMLFAMASSHWSRFRDQLAANPRDKTKLAESYLDAHDAVNDIANAFDLKTAMGKIMRRGA